MVNQSMSSDVISEVILRQAVPKIVNELIVLMKIFCLICRCRYRVGFGDESVVSND